MGICGTKQGTYAPSKQAAAQVGQASAYHEPPASESTGEEVVLLGRSPAVSSASLPPPDQGSHEPPDEPEQTKPAAPSRARTVQSWSEVAKESSLWRARLVVDSRGRINDCYTVDERKLGQGSYGYVCRGISRETGSTRAVKFISKARASDLRKRFRQEVDIMKGVDHPNIVKLVETYEDKEHIFLVMELCSGGDLYHRLHRDGPFQEATAAFVMQQIFRPVCYMHEKNICHRDIKPENFLLLTQEPVKQNTLKLTDFGFSCPVQPGRFLSTKLGTPRYSSPQVLAGSYDRSCDLWSCGVIMFVVLSGNSPFTGRSDAEVMQCVRRGNYRFAPESWSNISDNAKSLIRLLLKYQPAERNTAEQSLAHPWITSMVPEPSYESLRPCIIADLSKFCGYNRLRQAALQIVAQQLSEEETKAFRSSFAALDKRGNGVLTVAELADCLEGDDEDETGEVMQMARELTGQGNSVQVGYTDFIAATLDVRRHVSEGACLAAFRAFDRNADGRISKDELEELLKSSTGQVDSTTAADITDLLEEVDVNRDGAIDFEEFKSMLLGDHQRDAPDPRPGV